MNRKFDFSEIDEALPAAEKMQEKDRMAGALENNYEAIRLLNANVEKLESRLSEALPKVDGAVSSLHRASTVSVSEESRQVLEQEGEKICQKMVDRMESECAKLARRFSANERVLISATAFWCMVEISSPLRRPLSVPALQMLVSYIVHYYGKCLAVPSLFSLSVLR